MAYEKELRWEWRFQNYQKALNIETELDDLLLPYTIDLSGFSRN